MTSPWVAFPLVLVTAVLASFLFVRLQLQNMRDSGRSMYLGGAFLIILVTTWSALTSLPSYPTWFVITAYPILSTVQYIIMTLGFVLVTISLTFYADHHETRREELRIREEKLNILQSLQQDTRAPYQLLELLNLTLKEILLQTPDRAGAIFLVNRGKRQLILGASAGLSKNETASLEHLALDRNAVAQSVELGDPMIAGGFDFTDPKGHPIPSRFESSLIMPLISGMEKIGAVVLLAEESKSFSRIDVSYLAPVAEWLAEKIRSARLARDLSISKNELEKYAGLYGSLIGRLTSIGGSLAGANALGEFCRQMAGVASSSEVHLCGLMQGTLQIYAGSESLVDFTEQYKTALIDALNRRKPLIINHESADRDGHTAIVRSSLIYPIGGQEGTEALLLRKDGGPFSIGDQELKLLDFFGQIAKFALSQRETSKRDLTRRVGFDKVLDLIRISDSQPDIDAGYFMRHLADILPVKSQAITFARHDNGSLAAMDGIRVSPNDLNELLVEPGEGDVGQAVATRQPRFASGKKQVLSAIEAYEPNNRHAFHRLFGERRLPNFVAVCPVAGGESILGATVFLFFDLEDSERPEWERLLTLASGLFSLRLSLIELVKRNLALSIEGLEPDRVAPLINQLNNHLSAVIGNADMASRRDDLDGDLRVQLKSISAEAERAAQLIKTALVPSQSGNMVDPIESVGATVNDIIDEVLLESHIAGDLFMAGGRPREINLKLDNIASIAFTSIELRQFFEAVLNRFAAIATDEDVFTIHTYQKDKYVYLDISRHRKNFPPVGQVASFGAYQLAGQALQARPSDVFLQPLAAGTSYFAADTTGATPAYLSFKFPLRSTAPEPEVSKLSSKTRQMRILAIDDQEVILDLISAMCQSLGYEVQAVTTGSEGVKLASTHKFDVVLTDLSMPDMTGLEVARQVRKTHPDTPIILVTGWEAGLDADEVEAAGITETLLKPFRIEQLTDIVRSAAARRP